VDGLKREFNCYFVWIEDEWIKGCKGSDDEIDKKAVLLLTQRGWDSILIPVYDLFSHQNGHLLNTIDDSVFSGSGVTVRASRDIQKHEEINTSYNFCRDCGGRQLSYGTAEIFRDYGFVEQYPQRWIFPLADEDETVIAFDIGESEDENDENPKLYWIGSAPSYLGLLYLSEMRTHLNNVSQELETAKKGNIPQNELDSITMYHESVLFAINLAIKSALHHYDVDVSDLSANTSPSLSCENSNNRYPNLMEDTEEFDINVETCKRDEHLMFKDFYDLYEITSSYQDISFFNSDSKQDMCFEIGTTLQICSSYRPQYHEIAIHYAARFLPSVKRVLWVGGGDSMLLHEILKIPSIELAVGLELDQSVTRSSFEFFGTQPHWDLSKVQWWFGDAAKSLLMLPRDYFNSFDLVIADMSETIMSKSVTDDLNIMETLALLLKPDGIMVKNEFYFEGMSKMFEHTIQIHLLDIPIICNQAFSFGSNEINFISHSKIQNLVTHGIQYDHLFLRTQSDILDESELQQHNSIIHDYRRNSKSNEMQYCKSPYVNPNSVPSKELSDLADDPTTQMNSAGILMIVEAENAFGVNQPFEYITRIIIKGLKTENLSHLYSLSSSNAVVFILKEGYIIVNVWSSEKYCEFDIHLWSDFEKQDDIKQMLVSSVGSSDNLASSYRVIVGGMIGCEKQRKDKKNRGPPITELSCNEQDVNKANISSKETVVKEVEKPSLDIILEELDSGIFPENGELLVFCGKENDTCNTYEHFKKNEHAKNVHVIWACAELENTTDGCGSGENMMTCENYVTHLFSDILTKEKKISSIIIDSAVPIAMGGVMFRVLSLLHVQKTLFSEDITLVSLSSQNLEWHQNFMNRFRKEVIVFEPVFKSHMSIHEPASELENKQNRGNNNIEMNIVMTDKNCIQKLSRASAKIEERTDFSADILHIYGGLPHHVHNYEPKMFRTSDYSNVDAIRQWDSQNPLEIQEVCQLQSLNGDLILSSDMVNDAAKHTLRKLEHALGIKITDSHAIDIARGSLFTAIWSTGRVVIVWNGGMHIDVNLFLSLSHSAGSLHHDFVESFKEKIPDLVTVSCDEQPRGTGRLVRYVYYDVEEEEDPIWI